MVRMSYRDVGLPWLRNLCVLLLDHKEEIFLPFLLHMDLLSDMDHIRLAVLTTPPFLGFTVNVL